MIIQIIQIIIIISMQSQSVFVLYLPLLAINQINGFKYSRSMLSHGIVIIN